MDRFTRIAVFVAAMDEGSLVAAGKKFGLSASMAGKYVSALEAELKVRLMHRSTRSLSLTEAGQAYYLRCRRILEEFGEANEEASDAGSTTRGLLRVAAPVTFGELHVGEVLSRATSTIIRQSTLKFPSTIVLSTCRKQASMSRFALAGFPTRTWLPDGSRLARW
jgi:DNA-binding transcriptional LysR family regulator